jgi:translocator protein
MSYMPSITLPATIFNTPAVSILLPVGLGLLVGFYGRGTTPKTYMELKQPPYRPPPQVFGPVWTVLYGLMGYGAYRAWTVGMSSLDPLKVEDARRGATLYTVQLALNLLWMPLFFYLKRPIEATVDIFTLTGTVGYLTYVWGKVDPIASYCLMPYVAWLGFASYLTVGVGHLNDWDLANKEKPKAQKDGDTKFVNEDPKTQ